MTTKAPTIRQAGLLFFYILCRMSIEEYKNYCIYRGEHFLTWLRDGDYECHILADMGGVSEIIFKDIVALLMAQKLVELYDDDTKIRLTNPGRLYLLNEATDIVHAGDGMLYKQAYPGGRKTEHPREKVTNLESALNDEQTKSLVQFLEQRKYMNNPSQFVSFLKGLNDGLGIELSNDAITEVCYLLDLLYRNNIIWLKGKKGYQNFIASQIRPFSEGSEKEQKEQIKAALRKMQNKKWKDSGIERVLIGFVNSLSALSSKQIVLFMFCLSQLQ